MLSSLYIKNQKHVISDHYSVLTTNTCETMVRSNVSEEEDRRLEGRAQVRDYVSRVMQCATITTPIYPCVEMVRSYFANTNITTELVSDDQIREIIQELIDVAANANANANLPREEEDIQEQIGPPGNANANENDIPPRDDLSDDTEIPPPVERVACAREQDSAISSLTDATTGDGSASSIAAGGDRAIAVNAVMAIGNVNENDAAANISEDSLEN